MLDLLFAWYERYGRDFPWRQTTDPWAILVSEVMSQQTQIDRVASRYEDFLTRFPNPQAMADASTADVLTAWSGLGYNRRALNLQATAREVARSGWPTSAANLAELPGIGPYTAAAVACFAFEEQVPAVDTNLKRVLSRWVGRPLAGRELATTASEMLPAGQAGRWNSALMDLGAQLCRPTPNCDDCPVVESCIDPSVYVPPPRQARFDGSVRQTRGAIVRVMLDGQQRTAQVVAAAVGHDEERVTAALEALIREGVIVSSGEGYSIGHTAGVAG